MESNKGSKGLSISIWGLTVAIVVSTLVELIYFNGITDSFREVEDKSETVDISDQLEELYLQKEYASLTKVAGARISSHPNYDYSYFYLGLMHYEKENWGEAKKYLENALRLDPSWGDRVYKYLDIVNGKLGEF